MGLIIFKKEFWRQDVRQYVPPLVSSTHRYFEQCVATCRSNHRDINTDNSQYRSVSNSYRRPRM